MKQLVILTLIVVQSAIAAEGIKKLIGDDQVNNFAPIKIKRAVLNLDDPFLVQAYGTLRELGIKDQKILEAFDLVFAKKYQDALTVFESLTDQSALIEATKLYLIWKNKLSQTFINRWVKLANSGFLNSRLGVALDEVVGSKFSQWMIKQGVFLSRSQQEKLFNLGLVKSRVNYSLQAMIRLRKRSDTLKVIPYLEAGDQLRLRLAESLILDYAKQGKLSDAAKVLKGVFEPVLSQAGSVEDISFYYLNLARLLYQARAFDAAWEYYQLIPDESKHYMKAQTESLWISMQKKDFAKVKGQAKTLEMEIFANQFYPERHLVTAMAHLQTCQFSKVEQTFKRFVKDNQAQAKVITKNLASPQPEFVDASNFYVTNLKKAQKNIEHELALGLDQGLLVSQRTELTDALNWEKHRQWANRKQLLETAIYRMRFVKVEYLSTMRRLKDKLVAKKSEDKVKLISSSLQKKDRVIFPFDGTFFADELFQITSAVENLCKQGKKL